MCKSGAHELVERDGEVADAFAGRVIDGVGDGGCCSSDANLSDASRPERVEAVVGDADAGDVDVVNVGVDGDVILGEVFVDGAAVDFVNQGLFVE
jgi:hypothetical protein